MGRAPFSKQNEEKNYVGMGVKKGPWSAEEDQKLIAYIWRYGIWNWTHMPKPAGLARSGKSCRLRWMNYLRPNIKHGNFSKEEEETIIKWQKLWGNRWSAIATKLLGRTDNEIKNYWNSSLKKRTPPEESVQAPPKNHPGSQGVVAATAPRTRSIKNDHPNILESFSQEGMSGSSAGTPEASGFEETSKSPFPVDWINNEVGDSDDAVQRSASLEAVGGLELDFWERMFLPPLEDVSMEMDFEATVMVSSGFELPSINYQPESSTDGYLVYDYLWTD